MGTELPLCRGQVCRDPHSNVSTLNCPCPSELPGFPCGGF